MLAPLRTIASRFLGLFSKRSLNQDFSEELQSHLSMLVDENIRGGMTPQQALRQAHLTLGNLGQLKEIQQERHSLPQVETLFHDIRYALRTLRKSPGFTLVAVLTLALGIGVNTTLFTAFDAIALKPLPVADAAHVIRIERWFQSRSQGNLQYFFSYPEYLYYRAHASTLSTLTAVSRQVPVIGYVSQGRAPERLEGELVADNYFSSLGVDFLLGRTFLPEETRAPGTHPVIVLSYPFWRARCNADPQILGKTIRLSDTAFTVIGVSSQDFIGTGNPPQVPDFWASIMMQAELLRGQDYLHSPNTPFLKMFGRLAPGISIKNAQSEMLVITHQFQHAYPAPDKTIAIALEPATFFGETNSLQFRAVVILLMFLVGMVLLIACANLANMLLARAAGRQREIGIRLALGAGRARLIRQLLTESVLLALFGGAVGLLFAIWASQLLWVGIEKLLQSLLWSNVTLVVSLSPDIRIFAYTFAVSLITGIVFGLAPALQTSKRDIAFRQASNRSRLRSSLLAGQIAISMLLLITAGLLMRGLLRSLNANPGFETRNVFLVAAGYGADPAKATALFRRVVEKLRNMPQVQSLTVVERPPMTGTWTPYLRVEQTHAVSPPDRTLANRVSPSYFATLGIPILRGRTFSRQESETSGLVAIVSESTAHRLWPSEDPLGKHAQLDLTFNGNWSQFEIIGVAKDARTANLSRIDPALFYLPTGLPQPNTILIRTVDDGKNTRAAVRASVEALDRTLQPSFAMSSLEEAVVSKQRFLAKTYATFAVMLATLALALAGVGIYGVMSYLVSQRVREIGICMALGATARNVVGSVVSQGLRPVFIGAVAGLAAAAGMSTVLRATLKFPGTTDLLFGVSVFDPLTFLGLSAFLAFVASIASAIPARRATQIDPMEALRYE